MKKVSRFGRIPILLLLVMGPHSWGGGDQPAHPILGPGPLALSAEGRIVIFSARLPQGAGGLDLYVGFRHPNGSWVGTLNLGRGINTPEDELLPRFSEDGRALFFLRGSELRWVDLSALQPGLPTRSP